MGQIIEWLIFGHVVELSIRYNGILYVFCWGSTTAMGELQIRINGFAAGRMFAARPPIRMTGNDLRIFLENMRLERIALGEQAPQPHEISGVPLTDLDMPDADSQYSGHQIDGGNVMYRRSIWRIRAEERRVNQGLPPLLGVPKVVRGSPIDQPVEPPGVARLFLRARYVAFAIISGFALYLALSPNPRSWSYSKELVINFFEPKPIYILFILPVAVFSAGKLF